ncbi:MAG: PspC domain-containing protein [Microthrixaceae bacterium]|nr:PspC domain-containing protein [Microthrixaceae bacterium]
MSSEPLTHPEMPTADPATFTDPVNGLDLASPTAQPLVLGVCAAIADRTGVSLPLVRATFITLAAAGGLGLAIYLLVAVFWRDRTGPVRDAHAGADTGMILLLIGLVWITLEWWPGTSPGLVVPVALVSVGVALGWKSMPVLGSDRSKGSSRWARLSGATGRVVGGTILCIGGLAVMLGQNTDLSTFRDTALALAVALTGIGLVLGPSVVSGLRSLTSERDERVRAQERAAVATHLHDSVLQTLTLIQKRSDDPMQVASLARHEERALRRWLYGGPVSYDSGPSGIRGDEPETSWRTGFEMVVEELEAHYGIAVELVMVGHGTEPAFEEISPIIAATREALVNAMKFAGQRTVSVYVELSADRLDVFVRDRGIGFEPSNIAGDRHGIRDSIIGRMSSAGGSAGVRSDPGEGTEVALSIPVKAIRTARDRGGNG